VTVTGGIVGGIVGFGRLIDWYIGKAGQRRFSDLMMNWGAQLENMEWAFFGREEARFAVRGMDRLFGRRFFSIRRMLAVVVAIFVVSGFTVATMILDHISLFSWSAFFQPSHQVLLVIVISAFAASFSVTRVVSVGVAYFLGNYRYINLLGFIFLLLFQYALLCYWTPVMDFAHFHLINVVMFPSDPIFILMPIWTRLQLWYYLDIQGGVAFSSLLAVHGAGLFSINTICSLFTAHRADVDPDNFILHCSALLNLIPNLTRMLLAVIFIGSFFLQPLKRHPIMTLWERIMESEKPFTLLGIGVGGVVAIMHDLC
jgi:hypothetical protein